MFAHLLKIACGGYSEAPSREEAVKDIPTATEPLVIAQKDVAQTIDDPELIALEHEFGRLEKGKSYEISLTRLLEIIPRVRAKADAYKGLLSKLRGMDITLNITSRKRKGETLDDYID